MRRIIPFLLLGATALPAQYALSAMAGYIHHTEGEVWLSERAIAPKATDFEHVTEGRRLRTGQGKAEILLVPGSFVRVGAASEIEMVSSGLTSASLRLLAGSLVVDLQTLYEKDSIAVLAGDREVRFRKTGLYRIDAAEGKAPRLRVVDGRARVAEGAREAIEVKAGQEVAFDATEPEKAGNGADALDDWNSARHEKLAELADEVRKASGDGISDEERGLLRMVLIGPGD